MRNLFIIIIYNMSLDIDIIMSMTIYKRRGVFFKQK